MSTPGKISEAYLETVELRKKYDAAVWSRSDELAKDLGAEWEPCPGTALGGGLMPVPGARLLTAWVTLTDDEGLWYSGPSGSFPISIENAQAGVWESTP